MKNLITRCKEFLSKVNNYYTEKEFEEYVKKNEKPKTEKKDKHE